MFPEQIQAVNSKVADSWNHGIYTEPSYVPNKVKEPVFYWRHSTGGSSGASCWDNAPSVPYTNREPQPGLQALDAYLELYQPQVTFMQYKKLESMFEDNTGGDWDYYGNGTEYLVRYLSVAKVEAFFANL